MLIIETNGVYSNSPGGEKPLGLGSGGWEGGEYPIGKLLKKAKNTNAELCKY